MMFISIDPSAGAPRSAAANGTTRTECRRLVQGRPMTGGKGGKGGSLESLGNTVPADDVAQRRKPAETGGNPSWGRYSGSKVFSGAGIGPPHRDVGDWHIACGNCGNPHDESHWGLAPALPERGRRIGWGSGNCANPLGCRCGRCFSNAVAGAGGVAESAETPYDDSAGVWRRPSETSETSETSKPSRKPSRPAPTAARKYS
jgi:hypothetical protein